MAPDKFPGFPCTEKVRSVSSVGDMVVHFRHAGLTTPHSELESGRVSLLLASRDRLSRGESLSRA